MPTTSTTIMDGARLLARHGGVVEVRILNTPKGTVSGYFDDLEALAQAVAEWDGRASIYVTANPVLPDLLARARNRLKGFARATTEDGQITRRRWLLVDLDPKRPAGISATAEELAAALERRNALVAFLTELGFPEPVVAMSGNGGHAIWPVDLPNDEGTTRLIEHALKALKAKFSDAVVDVDEAVYNGARIWKLYGSIAVKGDSTPERPHRRAQIERIPDTLVTLDRVLIEQLAAMAPAETTSSAGGGRAHRGPVFDLVGLFRERGLYRKPLHGGKHAVVCPWNGAHSGDSGLTETCLFEPKTPGHPWGFDCRHAHCAGRTIKDVIAWLGVSSSNGSHGGGPVGPEAPWPTPQPIPDTLPPVPAFAAERLLPPALMPWIVDITDRSQRPSTSWPSRRSWRPPASSGARSGFAPSNMTTGSWSRICGAWPSGAPGS
jgi:hypothetical protein